MFILKDLRKEKGYTQSDVAKALCVSQQTVAKWESGSAIPRIDKLQKLADLFGCSIGVLIKNLKQEVV